MVMMMVMTAMMMTGVALGAGDESSGCLGFGYCCPGRNLTCSSTGQRSDNKDPTATCFCDEECLTIGDCCLDYRAACTGVDCVMADRWDSWSDCDTRCGYGAQVRFRRVLVEPKYGGQPCGETVQRRLCEGTHCKLPRSSRGAVSQLKETASIVPATYGSWRSDELYSPFEDIRQNLFMHLKYQQLKSDHRQPSYCAKFEVTETRAACHRRPRRHRRDHHGQTGWTEALRPGSIVCVECQQFAALRASVGRRCAGHGVFQRPTAWKAVTIPRCHGKWTLVSRHVKPCQCDPRSHTSFVFV